ncbi:methyl-accepting chemotaxis protein [Methyloraptor flagellatus]|uniref:Methyl-accepting chemotaxis protein n=1 Tax=Methyloraptor flagellatus TaxID=3162530 RepID=A0AAU7X6L1_9HYPH
MKSLSVASVLRFALIGLALALAIDLGRGAQSSWSRLVMARETMEITTVSTQLFNAFQNVRLDRGNTYRELMSDKTGITPLTERLRTAGNAGYVGAIVALKAASIPERDTLVAELEANHTRLLALQAETNTAMAGAKTQARIDLAARWQAEMTSQIESLTKLSESLGLRIKLRDPVVDTLLAVKDAALDARNNAGDATLLISNATSGVKLPADAASKFYLSLGAARAALKDVRGVLRGLPISTGLEAALADLDRHYSGKDFQDKQLRQFQALSASEKPPLDTAQWGEAYLAALGSIAKVATEALAQAEFHAATEASAARRDFFVQSGLLALGILFAGAMLFVVGRRVITPLAVLRERMEQLAIGRLDIEAPYTERSDEIGALGQTMALFRANMEEAERLRGARADQERDAAAARRREMLALADQFDHAVGQTVAVVSDAAHQLQTAAQVLSSTAERTSQQSMAVAAASEQASANVASVAGATEELASSVTEIARRVEVSSTIARAAVREIDETNSRVAGLGQAADRVGSIVTLIEDIASKTNLLALNATIEAARAGAAGKGFAVVAAEVKQLADQTTKATGDIGAQIQAMQSASLGAAEAITGIGETIQRMNDIAGDVAAAVDGQGQATAEIARNVSEAAQGTSDVSGNIAGVTEAAAHASKASADVLASASHLSRQASALSAQVADFLARVRAA